MKIHKTIWFPCPYGMTYGIIGAGKGRLRDVVMIHGSFSCKICPNCINATSTNINCKVENLKEKMGQIAKEFKLTFVDRLTFPIHPDVQWMVGFAYHLCKKSIQEIMAETGLKRSTTYRIVKTWKA